MHTLAHDVCDDEHPQGQEFCANLFYSIVGVSAAQLNKTMMSFYLDHLPAGSSTEPIVHYAQLTLYENEFKRFDYGIEGNMEHYGTTTPPEYDLSKVQGTMQ